MISDEAFIFGLASISVCAYVSLALFVLEPRGDHVNYSQHDFNWAVEVMLNQSNRTEFTIITTRQYEMAFYALKNDFDQKRMYIILIPENKTFLEEMLSGKFRDPELASEMGQRVSSYYNETLPPVQFVVIHNGYEFGPTRPGYFTEGNDTKRIVGGGVNNYNAFEFMDNYSKVTKRFLIPSEILPEHYTLIYEVKNELLV